MKHSHLESQLIDYLEGSLSDAEKDAIDGHLLICEDCKSLVQDVARTYGLIEQECKVDVNPFFYTRFMAVLDKSISRSHIRRLVSVVWRPVIIILAVVLGITIGNGEAQILEDEALEVEFIANNFLPADYQDVVLTFETDQ